MNDLEIVGRSEATITGFCIVNFINERFVDTVRRKRLAQFAFVSLLAATFGFLASVGILLGWLDDVEESFFALASSSFSDLISAVSDSTSARNSAMIRSLSSIKRRYKISRPGEPSIYTRERLRLRSVRDQRYHYIRNFTPGAGFATLNRYKEKCFPVKPLMRELLAQGKLVGPPADLMKPFPDELLYDTQSDPFEIKNLADSSDSEHRQALTRMRAALDTWIVETGDRGEIPEPREIVAPFEKEMHDWFGTPEWYKK